jgi:predicted nucleic acid-binding protein
VNASPLIFLAEVGLLEVLRQPGVPVLVPDAVLEEISRLGPHDPAIRAVQGSPWIQIVTTPVIPDVVRVWDLGAGETAVLAVALEAPDSMAVMDDQPARRCARVLGVPTQGTLGLVLLAKQQGLIPVVRPMLEQLKQAGMYLTDSLERQILEAAGESP